MDTTLHVTTGRRRFIFTASDPKAIDFVALAAVKYDRSAIVERVENITPITDGRKLRGKQGAQTGKQDKPRKGHYGVPCPVAGCKSVGPRARGGHCDEHKDTFLRSRRAKMRRNGTLQGKQSGKQGRQVPKGKQAPAPAVN